MSAVRLGRLTWYRSLLVSSQGASSISPRARGGGSVAQHAGSPWTSCCTTGANGQKGRTASHIGCKCGIVLECSMGNYSPRPPHRRSGSLIPTELEGQNLCEDAEVLQVCVISSHPSDVLVMDATPTMTRVLTTACSRRVLAHATGSSSDAWRAPAGRVAPQMHYYTDRNLIDPIATLSRSPRRTARRSLLSER